MCGCAWGRAQEGGTRTRLDCPVIVALEEGLQIVRFLVLCG